MNKSLSFLEVYQNIQENIKDPNELEQIKEAYNFALYIHEGKKD